VGWRFRIVIETCAAWADVSTARDAFALDLVFLSRRGQMREIIDLFGYNFLALKLDYRQSLLTWEPSMTRETTALTEGPGMIGQPCPLCGESSPEVVGEIFHPCPTMVAGVLIDLSGKRFHLLQCHRCALQFKSPSIPEEELLACYKQAVASHWGETVDPVFRNFDVMKALLLRHAPGRRVLDIGCFTGTLLSYLGSEWSRYGIEPAVGAAALARNRGIDILGPTLEELTVDVPAFDAVVAIDVLEHIAEPMPFFRRVHRLLRPGGIFLGVTGDTASGSWRLEKNRYWYCSLPEHVSFYSCRTAHFICQQLGWTVEECIRHRHDRPRIHHRAIETFKNLGYVVGLRTQWLVSPAPMRRYLNRRAPGWITAKDHMYFVMRRNEADA
jgi:SAM-dependent methyltransferase